MQRVTRLTRRKKKAAAPVAQAAEKMPEPEEMVQQAKSNPEDLQALIRQLIDLLNKTDQASDADDIKPGLEQGIDKAIDAVEAGAEETLPDVADDAAAGGDESPTGGPTVAVFKGKGGKGLQSFLDRSKSGVPGKVYGAILKHVANNLKSQGVTVTESVLDDVQGWVWYGLVESAYRAKYGETALLKELKGNPADFEAKAGEEAGGEAAGGPEPVIQIYKGRKGKGLQSWMDINKGKLANITRTKASVIGS